MVDVWNKLNGWKTILVNGLILVIAFMGGLDAYIPAAFHDKFVEILAMLNILLRLISNSPAGPARMVRGLPALLFVACLAAGSAMAGEPTQVAAKPEPPAVAKRVERSVVVEKQRPAACQCKDCTCDPCTCGGRWVNVRHCEGGTCRIERKFLVERNNKSDKAVTVERSYSSSGSQRWARFRWFRR